MLICLNVGNSNLKLGLVRGGELAATRRIASQREIGPDELELQLDGLLELEDERLADAESIVVASVVPAYDAALAVIAERRDVPLLVAGPDTVPMPVCVERPAEIGADRLVTAYAAARLHGTPAVVVDLGTATTVTAVAADGAFLGGAIAPGARLGLEALAARTAKLPRIELRTPEAAIGQDTTEALRSGAVFGHLGLLRELVDRIGQELGEGSAGRPRLVFSGGLAAESWLAELEPDVVDPDLTLRGLALLHAELTSPAVRGPTPGTPGSARP